MKWILAILFPLLILPLKSLVWIPADLLFLAIVVYAFHEETLFAFAVTLLYGFFNDALSFSPMGTHLCAYGFVFAAIRFSRAKIPFDGWLGRFVWIFFLSLVLCGVKALYIYWVAGLTRPLFSTLILWFGNPLLGLAAVPLFRLYQNLTPGDFVEAEDSLLKKTSWT